MSKENIEKNTDKTENKQNKGMSRRDFLKNSGFAIGGGIVGAGLAYQGTYNHKLACPYCDESFTTNRELNDHILSEHAQSSAPGGSKWPWEVNYGSEEEIETDVLVIGCGLAGAHAAINAAKKGAKVVVIDKGAVSSSGSGGSGIDHWLGCVLNPYTNITLDQVEMIVTDNGVGGDYGLANARYVIFRESWDALMDLEKWGMQVKDTNDEFKGASFRDDDSKYMFAYNYDDRTNLRLPGGHKMKKVLYDEMVKQGITILDYTMATSLLTHQGKVGNRVVGATGLNVRTGEFKIIKSKATILTTARPQKLWIFNTELAGNASSMYDPNNTGDGYDIAWRAGAEFLNMEVSHTGPSTGGFTYPFYGVGNAQNTWYGCNIVDSEGREVPWEDAKGNILPNHEDRYHVENSVSSTDPGRLISDLPEKIKQGEFKLPLYADLPGMPEMERKALWGLQVGNEGKTRFPIYDLYSRYGFDPEKDMLQVPILSPDTYNTNPVWWMGEGPPQWRETCFLSGHLMVDWSLRSSLVGLYSAGGIGGQASASGSSATGRYAGRQAAVFAKSANHGTILRDQIDKEKERVYAPVTRTEGIGWKELKAGLCRIMQEYCGEYRSKEILETGLKWFDSISEKEAQEVYARNPHELARVLECYTHANVGRMMMYASLERKASSRALIFKRYDYPEMDPAEWNKFISIKYDGSDIKVRDIPKKYWCKAPYASSYKENYERHCNL